MSSIIIEVAEKLKIIVFASEEKQTRLYTTTDGLSRLFTDCFVAYAPRNDNKKGLFQQYLIKKNSI